MAVPKIKLVDPPPRAKVDTGLQDETRLLRKGPPPPEPKTKLLIEKGFLSNRVPYVSDDYLQSLVQATKVKYGLVSTRGTQAVNPGLILESTRPSIICQHLEYVKKKRVQKVARDDPK